MLLKSLILPTVVRALLELLGASATSLDFAFVFCLFSASGANMVYVLAKGPTDSQKATLMCNLALSKVVAFPLLIVASAVLFTRDAAQMAAVSNRVAALVQPVALAFVLYYLVSANVLCSGNRPRPHPPWTIFILLEAAFLATSVLLIASDC